MNYFGFSKEVKFGKNCGGILKTSLEWNDVTKKVSTFFMGLSPELEIALYTLAALLAPNTVKSRAVYRSTIQFLTIFGVLLTETCY